MWTSSDDISSAHTTYLQYHSPNISNLVEVEVRRLLTFLSQCGEERPVCRNCTKSKRQCQGYDPIFQAQQSQSIQPAPVTSTTTSISTIPHAPQSRTSYSSTADPISPSTSSQNNSGSTSSPREAIEYTYHRNSDLPVLPNINQGGYKMENHYATAHITPRCE